MVVPYGDPRPTYFHRNAFDVGEYGVGYLANSLELAATASARSGTSTPSSTTAGAAR